MYHSKPMPPWGGDPALQTIVLDELIGTLTLEEAFAVSFANRTLKMIFEIQFLLSSGRDDEREEGSGAVRVAWRAGRNGAARHGRRWKGERKKGKHDLRGKQKQY